MASAYNFMLMAHSGWRYLVVVLLLVALIKYLIGWLGKGEWSGLDAQLARFTPIVLDIQVLLGIIVLVLKLVAGQSLIRQHWEHVAILVLAAVTAHFVSTRVKKPGASAGKYTIAAVGYIVTALLVFLGVSTLTGWNIFA